MREDKTNLLLTPERVTAVTVVVKVQRCTRSQRPPAQTWCNELSRASFKIAASWRARRTSSRVL